MELNDRDDKGLSWVFAGSIWKPLIMISINFYIFQIKLMKRNLFS